MKPKRKGSRNLAWRGACATCGAALDLLRTIFVLALAVVTAFVAYVATLEELPVPNFLIRELRAGLKSNGAAIAMEGIRLTPDGRILIESPTIRSEDLNSVVASADFAAARVNLPALLIGKLRLDRVTVSNGRIFMPAILSASGLDETIAESIALDARRRTGAWTILYANAKVGAARLSASGTLKPRLFQPAEPQDGPGLSLRSLNRRAAQTVTGIQKQIALFSRPSLVVTLDLDPDRRQTAQIQLTADRAVSAPDVAAQRIRLRADWRETRGAAVALDIGRLEIKREFAASNVSIRSAWDVLPRLADARPIDWLPRETTVALGRVGRGELSLPSVAATVRRDRARVTAQASFAVADAPWKLRLERNLASGKTRLQVDAALGEALPRFLNPLADELAQIDLVEMAWLRRDGDLVLDAQLDANWKAVEATAFADVGAAVIRGARLDRAYAKARLEGSKLHVTDIRIRSGLQDADIAIQIDTDTLARRILLEGNVDPRMINGWFKPWWTAMWDGMEFPAEGMYTAMDSRGIFGKPEAARVTGIGYAKRMDIRSLPAEEIRLRYFSRFHYVDLYDIELQTPEGRAAGETQFTLGRDPRDDKDKLTGIWIDADSTIDLKRGPEVLWEIRDAVADILDPYGYEAPPHVVARSSSVRRQDVFENDIDLQVESPLAFSFFGFPFESVKADLAIGNGRVFARSVEAGVGGGALAATALITGDAIDVEARLEGAGFGETLVAANAYFAANGSEKARAADPEGFLQYRGTLDANFDGEGLVSDPLSYVGGGSFDIREADFGTFRLFGLLSMALEITPFRFSTLKFRGAEGDYRVEKRFVRFEDASIDGPVAAIQTAGTYDLETDEIDFKAKLFPFRNSRFPIIAPLLHVALAPVSHALEITATGPFDDPRISLLDSSGSSDSEPPPEPETAP